MGSIFFPQMVESLSVGSSLLNGRGWKERAWIESRERVKWEEGAKGGSPPGSEAGRLVLFPVSFLVRCWQMEERMMSA